MAKVKNQLEKRKEKLRNGDRIGSRKSKKFLGKPRSRGKLQSKRKHRKKDVQVEQPVLILFIFSFFVFLFGTIFHLSFCGGGMNVVSVVSILEGMFKD